MSSRAGGGRRGRMKKIRLSRHALFQCQERGTNEREVIDAVCNGAHEVVKEGRSMYRYEVKYLSRWQGHFYATKQIAPIVVEEKDEIVVVTVYTFYY